MVVAALMGLDWWIQQELNSWCLLFAARCCIEAMVLMVATGHSL
ncbi:hypothetical protein [Streptomyces mirabilis]